MREAIGNVSSDMDKIKPKTMNGVWVNVWEYCSHFRDFKEGVETIQENTLQLPKLIGLDELNAKGI